jgi:hypothetical protein
MAASLMAASRQAAALMADGGWRMAEQRPRCRLSAEGAICHLPKAPSAIRRSPPQARYVLILAVEAVSGGASPTRSAGKKEGG